VAVPIENASPSGRLPKIGGSIAAMVSGATLAIRRERRLDRVARRCGRPDQRTAPP
jgi:hypothetical protein